MDGGHEPKLRVRCSSSFLFRSATLPPYNQQAMRSRKKLFNEPRRAVGEDRGDDNCQHPAWLKVAEQLRKFRERFTVHDVPSLSRAFLAAEKNRPAPNEALRTRSTLLRTQRVKRTNPSSCDIHVVFCWTALLLGCAHGLEPRSRSRAVVVVTFFYASMAAAAVSTLPSW